MRARPLFLMLLFAGPAAGRVPDVTPAHDLPRLDPEERAALGGLPEAGLQIQGIDEDPKHRQAPPVRPRPAPPCRCPVAWCGAPDETGTGSVP